MGYMSLNAFTLQILMETQEEENTMSQKDILQLRRAKVGGASDCEGVNGWVFLFLHLHLCNHTNTQHISNLTTITILSTISLIPIDMVFHSIHMSLYIHTFFMIHLCYYSKCTLGIRQPCPPSRVQTPSSPSHLAPCQYSGQRNIALVFGRVNLECLSHCGSFRDLGVDVYRDCAFCFVHIGQKATNSRLLCAGSGFNDDCLLSYCKTNRNVAGLLVG